MNRFVVSLALAALSAAGAQAQSYPTRAVTVIVPFAAGGPADITGRIVADIFSRHLGQQFVVENVGGAGGTTGSLRGARAAPDGYTLVSGHMGPHAAAPQVLRGAISVSRCCRRLIASDANRNGPSRSRLTSAPSEPGV